MRVLVFLAGTAPGSNTVLPHAAALVAVTDSELVVAHVLAPGDEAARAQCEAELRTLLDSEQVSGRAMVTVREPEEDLPTAILRTAHEAGADLLAMTSRNFGPIRRTVPGSTTLSVLGRSEVPLLVAGTMVHDVAPMRDGLYRIIVACDLSEAGATAIHTIAPMAHKPAVDGALLHIYVPRPDDEGALIEPAERAEALETLRAQLPATMSAETMVHSIEEWERVDDAIIRVAEAYGANAIALSTRGHGAARHLLAGSIAMLLLGKSPLPLLLVRS